MIRQLALVSLLALGSMGAGECGGSTNNRAQIENGSACDNGIDDDEDGARDCADPDCFGSEYCADEPCDPTDCLAESCETEPLCQELCDDGVDNDRDGQTDCADLADCEGAPACDERCDDALDNDADGFIDCDDLDCDGDPACDPPPLAAAAGSWTAIATGCGLGGFDIAVDPAIVIDPFGANGAVTFAPVQNADDRVIADDLEILGAPGHQCQLLYLSDSDVVQVLCASASGGSCSQVFGRVPRP